MLCFSHMWLSLPCILQHRHEHLNNKVCTRKWWVLMDSCKAARHPSFCLFFSPSTISCNFTQSGYIQSHQENSPLEWLLNNSLWHFQVNCSIFLSSNIVNGKNRSEHVIIDCFHWERLSPFYPHKVKICCAFFFTEMSETRREMDRLLTLSRRK